MAVLYRVLITKSAEKALKQVGKVDQRRIAAAIVALAVDPFPQGVRKLVGYDATYRIRVGNFRIIYDVDSAEVLITVLKVGQRKDIYR